MKNLKRISVLTVVLAMTFMLCACSAYSGIESRMKKAGYEVASGESTETKTVRDIVKYCGNDNAQLLGIVFCIIRYFDCNVFAYAVRQSKQTYGK